MILHEHDQAEFVAINTIDCKPEYEPRFRELFKNRIHAIDRIPGFISMVVLEPTSENGSYLVVSYWTSQEAFDGWTNSQEFMEGHRRAFADLKQAKERGEEAPMKSAFATYSVMAR